MTIPLHVLRMELEAAIDTTGRSWVEAGRELKRLGPDLLSVIMRASDLGAAVEELKTRLSEC